jgi:hypothetical protein
MNEITEIADSLVLIRFGAGEDLSVCHRTSSARVIRRLCWISHPIAIRQRAIFKNINSVPKRVARIRARVP